MDRMVYKLYDLTDDEIKIIENNATPDLVIPAKAGIPETNAISQKQAAVYILASKPMATLYTGVTCGKLLWICVVYWIPAFAGMTRWCQNGRVVQE